MGFEHMSFVPEGVRNLFGSKTKGKGEKPEVPQKVEPPKPPMYSTTGEDLTRRGFYSKKEQLDVHVLSPEDTDPSIDLSGELLPEAITDALAKMGDKKEIEIISTDKADYTILPVGAGGNERTYILAKDGAPQQVIKSAPFNKGFEVGGKKIHPWEDLLEPVATALLHLPTPKENPDARYITNVTFVEYDEESERGFIGFEYANKGNLYALERSAEKKQQLPEPAMVAAVAEDVGRGLRILHDAGILHLDIKMENIVLNRDAQGTFEAKVTDFGVTSFSKEQKTSDLVVGTPFYIAPEKFKGRGSSAKSDVYALGIMMSELLLGRKNTRSVVEDSDGVRVEVHDAAMTGLIHKHIEDRLKQLKKDRVKQGLPVTKEEEAFFNSIVDAVQVDPEKRPEVDDIIARAYDLTKGRSSELLSEMYLTLGATANAAVLEDEDGGEATSAQSAVVEDADEGESESEPTNPFAAKLENLKEKDDHPYSFMT